MGQTGKPATVTLHHSFAEFWRLVAWQLLLALAGTVLTGFLFYQFQQHQLASTQAHSQRNDKQLMAGFKARREQQLQQLSSFIRALEGIPSALERGDHNLLQQLLERHIEPARFEWNLDHVALFDNQGQTLARWTAHVNNPHLEELVAKWVTAVNEQDRLVNVISCMQSCSHFLLQKIPRKKGTPLVLLVAISLIESMDQLHRASGKDVGLLTPVQNPRLSTDELVNRWGLSLYSLSDAAANEPVLMNLSTQFTPMIGVEQTVQRSLPDGFYEISLYPLSAYEDSFIVTLEDLTQTQHDIRRQTLMASLKVFPGLFVLLQILYWLQRAALQRRIGLRIQQTQSDATQDVEPTELELTNGEFQLTDTNTPIDFDLTSNDHLPMEERLDQLKKYNQDINRELAQQALLIEQERNQIRTILDNTQTIILTLQGDGKIASINRFGEYVTGYSAEELIDRNFIDLYPEEVPYALNHLHTMSAIAEGVQDSYRHEALLRCKDGKERNVLWLHCALDTDSDTPLLSTGLDITESKQLERNLSWLADHDSLTSLYNRRCFEKELEEAVDWANQHEAPSVLLYLDLDNFKDINDSCGHQVGDIILRKVANSLTTVTQDIDQSAHLICARLGGDEFAIILRNIDIEGASILSKRILDKLYQIRHEQDQVQFQLSCSIGIAPFPGSETSATELLSNADFAMYQAKLLGRNQFYVFSEDNSQREKMNHRLIWREKIESALSSERFILHYQPILNIQTGEISHYETLIRMLDDTGDLISPGVFINIAERLGLIHEIDRFILRSATRKLGELIRKGHNVTLAINLSGKAFDNPDLVQDIREALEEGRARAENLIFEITETAAVSDIVAAERIMTEVQALGCQFALDDFGVGFSSFYYLRELPVEYVKIDGSFVNDLAKNTDNQVLVKALSEVAIGFNKLSVAEFVDSIETLDLLRESKVNFAQGYFIGRPSAKIPVDPPELPGRKRVNRKRRF